METLLEVRAYTQVVSQIIMDTALGLILLVIIWHVITGKIKVKEVIKWLLSLKR